MARPVRRGDLEMLATPDLVVETGDRLVVLAPTDRLMQVRAHFGISIRGNAEFSYVSSASAWCWGSVSVRCPSRFPASAR